MARQHSVGRLDYDYDARTCIDDGTLALTDCAGPGPVGSDPLSESAEHAVQSILRAVDFVPGLRGAGVAVQFPTESTYRLRESRHASQRQTYVVAEAGLDVTALRRPEPSWWDRWNEVVLNGGGAAISWTGGTLSAVGEIPGFGASTVYLVASGGAAGATTAQGGLSVAKETSDEFTKYVASENGRWINTIDIILDVLSVAGGVAGALSTVRTGSTLLKNARYAKYLDKMPRGRLLKALERLQNAEENLSYFRATLERVLRSGKIAHPAGRTMSSDLLERALPHVVRQVRSESLSPLADAVSTAMATVADYHGGIGSESLGLVRVTIHIYQESIFDR